MAKYWIRVEDEPQLSALVAFSVIRTPLAVAVILLILIVSPSQPAASSSHASVLSNEPGLSCSNGVFSNAAQSTIGGLARADPTTNLEYAAAEAAGLYNAMCSNLQFADLVQHWGLQNLSLGLQGNTQTGVQFANLTITWGSWQGSNELDHQEYLSLNVLDGRLGGPFLSTYSQPHSRYGTLGTAYNDAQAGMVFEDLNGGSLDTLDRTDAFTETRSMGTECSQQSAVPVGQPCADSVAAVWVGLMGSQTDALLQTGYTYDASRPSSMECLGFANSCDYGLWYEDFEPNINYDNEPPPMPYPGDPTVAVGSIVEMDVYVYGSDGEIEINDDTTHGFWTDAVDDIDFTPVYSPYIVEAYGTASTDFNHEGGPSFSSQIAYLGNLVDFEYGYLGSTTTPNIVYISTVINDDWFGQEWLQQWNSGPNGPTNLAVEWPTGTGFNGGGSQTYLAVAWLTSDYNWCWMSYNYFPICG